MADMSKWLDMLVGPQLRELLDKGNVKLPMGAGATPPAPAGPSITDPIAPPPPIDLLGTTPQDAPLPGLGGPPLPPDIAPNPVPDVVAEGSAPLRVQGTPLNSAMGIEGPDPSRVENTGPLVPDQVPVNPMEGVPEVAPIAGPPAVAQQLAERKAPVQRSLQRPPSPGGGNRPLSPVAVAAMGRGARGPVMGRRTGPMGTPLHEGGFRSPVWSDRLSRK